MTNDKVDVYYSNGSDGGLYNLEYEINNHVTIVSNLRKMKKLREKVIGEMEKGQKSTEKSRVNLFKELGPLINNWKGQYPDLGKLLRHKEMDWLLMKYVEFIEMNKVIKTNLLSFVIECGYKGKPEIDKDNKALLRRTTPLHHAARSNKSYVISDLCKIYDRFNVAYIDEGGYTPFHVACRDGCYDVVEKFLELGQDPNCPLQKSVDPPLRLALYHKHQNVAELLLKNGANPNLADEDGLTPLHTICARKCDDDLAELFFQMCDDNNHPLQVDARDKFGDTPLHLALFNNNKKPAKLLLKRGANPNLINYKNGSTPLHFICSRECGDDFTEQFFQMCDDSNRPLQVDAQDKWDQTPLHLALFNNNKKPAELLLKRGANPNLADKYGSTPLHAICSRKFADDFDELFFKMCGDSKHPLQIDAQDKWDQTPLHLALFNNNKKPAELLLKRGANPNLADKYGSTPLHAICSRQFADDFDELFFKMCDDSNHPLQVDARDKNGHTPLHLALFNSNKKPAKLLLKRGANPNLADVDGLTPLHTICARKCDDDLAELFFKMCDDNNHSLQVDSRNKSDQTPLHLALFNNNKKAAKLLLKRGANPNLVNKNGPTSLHLICKSKNDAADLAETLFQVCDDRHQLVQVDTKDKSGWTPLQWAVANLRPNLVEVLLGHGAKLSNFVFPTMNHFNLGFVLMLDKTAVDAKLKVVFELRAVVKCLEKRGYKLKLQDIQTIKRLFDKYEVFKKLRNLDQRWYDKEKFSSEAKNIEMSPNQSLYDLVRSPPAKAKDILANEDYYHKLVSSTEWSKLPEEFRIASIAQLCEIMARGFLYKRRALASLVKLTRNKLPIFCYDMIIEPLTNKDLWHICLASPTETRRSL